MKYLITVLFAFATLNSFAQSKSTDEESTGFQKNKLFTGGNLSLGFGNGRTAIGVSPHFGYSVTKWLDVAVNLNFNYISQRDIYIAQDKIRQTTIGPGSFIRLFSSEFFICTSTV